MKSEHLENLHPGWVLGGWAVAATVTSAAYLGLVGTRLLPRGDAEILGLGLAMAVGFFVGGLFIGLRWAMAPVLHATALTLTSLVLWLVGSLASPGRFSAATPSVLGLLLVQLVAAALGGWTGRRVTLSGGRAV